MVMTCLGASSVLMAKGFSAFHIKMISLLIVVVSQFFFYCLIGETFSLMVSVLFIIRYPFRHDIRYVPREVHANILIAQHDAFPFPPSVSDHLISQNVA